MIKARDFRRLALDLPEVTEEEHHGHPDFRVGKKIFATLGGGEEWGMVRLPTDLQERLASGHPEVFAPLAGAWGRQGYTRVQLSKARIALLREAMQAAWRERAPSRLVRQYDEGGL
jgi:hypothetical protein